MSPNIPITTPIASSMNLSGLNINVGNLTAQTSSTWSIPNISVTPIPTNPTDTQMHVSEGPGSTHEISSKSHALSKFPYDFLLNPGWNPVVSQEPFGQSKQPMLIISSGFQVHVGNEKRVDGATKKTIGKCCLECLFHGLDMAPKGKSISSQQLIKDSNEIYASLPLFFKEKVTRHHHPYSFKPITSHASSSREKMVDDEDESMAPNLSETNDKPRRDNYMVHEEGTQSNSEFTHPQIPPT
ncbi:hypothetical protein O181_010295 [Austropuccinia psidii MF-1]|uniref:Uncharacterized protein n=1 Tax=Austropuccinia psidii MF-1 TaxID=1389203 RepID=A0A9Q3BTL1_9BASI|nr:hypothetical protein [Austropuccinia psidii MF-1]